MPAVRGDFGSAGRDALMAVGVLLTTATQFRLPGLPIGPGEICLALWIVLMLILELGRYTPLTPAFRRMLVFWSLFGFAQSLGTLTGMAIGDLHDPSLFWHDALAYPLVGAFGCLSVVEPGAAQRLRRAAEIFAAVGALCLLPQLAVGWDLIELPALDSWLGDRLQGWSTNPNQLAFLCAVLVLLSLHLADTAKRPGGRVAALLYIVPAVLVGRLTKTDTFTFALLGAVPIFFVMKLRFWLVASGSRFSFRASLAWIALIAIPLLLASAAPLVFSSVESTDELAMGLMKNGGKEAPREAGLRLALWSEAISRGTDSYMLGLGPGPHLPIPPEILAVRQSEPVPNPSIHPTLNGTPDFEAHNSLLDLFTQGGLLASLDFIWIAVIAWVAPYRARLAGLVALIAGVSVFGLTNNIVRPPIFWLSIALCIVAGDRAEGRSSAGRQG